MPRCQHFRLLQRPLPGTPRCFRSGRWGRELGSQPLWVTLRWSGAPGGRGPCPPRTHPTRPSPPPEGPPAAGPGPRSGGAQAAVTGEQPARTRSPDPRALRCRRDAFQGDICRGPDHRLPWLPPGSGHATVTGRGCFTHPPPLPTVGSPVSTLAVGGSPPGNAHPLGPGRLLARPAAQRWSPGERSPPSGAGAAGQDRPDPGAGGAGTLANAWLLIGKAGPGLRGTLPAVRGSDGWHTHSGGISGELC